jgi:hypothetical protein
MVDEDFSPARGGILLPFPMAAFWGRKSGLLEVGLVQDG